MCVQHGDCGKREAVPSRSQGLAPEGIPGICVANGLVRGPISLCCLLSVAAVPRGSLAEVHCGGNQCPVRDFTARAHGASPDQA